MRKRVAIIGAGIAGLATGCYLQMNGYETEIFELHDKPGGLCTSWHRQDYIIDGCIHWLVGSAPASSHYKLWNEVLPMDQVEFVYHDEFIRVEESSGNCIRVFTDINRLEQELLTKAPEDSKVIKELISAVRKFINVEFPVGVAPALMSFGDKCKMLWKLLPFLPTLRKWQKISIVEYAAKCSNELLRKTIKQLFFPETSMLFPIITLAWMHQKLAGYPIGGSLKFAHLIAQRYLVFLLGLSLPHIPFSRLDEEKK